MGNIPFHDISAFLHHKRRKEEAVMLTNVTAPPPRLLCFINTLPSLACLSRKGEPAYQLIVTRAACTSWQHAPVAHRKITAL